MASCPNHAAGNIIAAVCGTLLPPMYIASNALSRDAVSDASSVSHMGRISST